MSALIPLARVQFREAVGVPGISKPGGGIQYPTSEDVLLSSRVQWPQTARAKQCFELYLDPRTGCVLITHPQSGETEEVPGSLVKQMRRLDAKKAEAAA